MRRDGPGATRQRLGSASSTSTPWRRSIATVMSMWGMEGTGLPSCSTSTPSSYLAPGQQQRRDELRRRRRVDHHLAARHRARSADHEGQRAAVVVVDRHAERAQRGQHLADGTVAHVRRRRRRRSRPSRARPPAGRTGAPCRPARSRPRRRGRRAAGVTAQSSPDVSISAPRAVRAAAISTVSRELQGATYDGGTVGERGDDQRPVGQGLAAGQRTAASTGRGRAAPATGRRTSSRGAA